MTDFPDDLSFYMFFSGSFNFEQIVFIANHLMDGAFESSSLPPCLLRGSCYGLLKWISTDITPVFE